MTYQIYDIPTNVSSSMEQRGTKAKFWFIHPENGDNYLFKIGREATGENWAEKIACELCSALDIPHAEYELALYKGSHGVITKSFVPEGARLALGNELLSKRVKGYQDVQNYKSRQHTLRLVQAYLSATDIDIRLPNNWVPPHANILQVDVFTGYLMLDVLISNQDRHHENWGLVLDDAVYLTPTFDHGSSLGMNETDNTRLMKLNTKDQGNSIEKYVSRARSALFHAPSSRRPMKTLEAYIFSAKTNRNGASYWLDNLEKLTDQRIKDIVYCVPDDVSNEVEKEFAIAIILENKKRLLTVKEELQL